MLSSSTHAVKIVLNKNSKKDRDKTDKKWNTWENLYYFIICLVCNVNIMMAWKEQKITIWIVKMYVWHLASKNAKYSENRFSPKKFFLSCQWKKKTLTHTQTNKQLTNLFKAYTMNDKSKKSEFFFFHGSIYWAE